MILMRWKLLVFSLLNKWSRYRWLTNNFPRIHLPRFLSHIQSSTDRFQVRLCFRMVHLGPAWFIYGWRGGSGLFFFWWTKNMLKFLILETAGQIYLDATRASSFLIVPTGLQMYLNLNTKFWMYIWALGTGSQVVAWIHMWGQAATCGSRNCRCTLGLKLY